MITHYSVRLSTSSAFLAAALLMALPARAKDKPNNRNLISYPGCAYGHPRRYPAKIGKSGVIASYGFYSEKKWGDGILPVIEKLAQASYRASYSFDYARTYVKVVQHGQPSRSNGQIDEDFRLICQLVYPLGFEMRSLALRTPRDQARVELKRAAEKRQHIRTFEWAYAPKLNEVDALLRSEWKARGEDIFFYKQDVEFSRVRDVSCEFIVKDSDFWKCRVGVLGMSSSGPEYAQETLNFVRAEELDSSKSPGILIYEYAESGDKILVVD